MPSGRLSATKFELVDALTDVFKAAAGRFVTFDARELVLDAFALGNTCVTCGGTIGADVVLRGAGANA